MKIKFPFFILFHALILGGVSSAIAQDWVEPEVEQTSKPTSPYFEGLRNGMGIDITLNDYGFALGTTYRRPISPHSELYASFMIGNLRDATEQNFQTFYGEIIPQKYNRVINLPLMIGYRQRLVPALIYDDFRLHVEGAVGPTLSVAIPYFNDFDGNGIRNEFFELGPIEPFNDVFSGWDNSTSAVGVTGEFMISVDFGQNFKRFTTLRFGYVFNYFREGIQIMEPNRYVRNDRGQILLNGETGQPLIEPSNKPQLFFGSPQITLKFGNMW